MTLKRITHILSLIPLLILICSISYSDAPENLIKNGVAYIVSRKQIYNKGTIITPYSYVSINEGLRINIDTIDDLYLSQHYESLLD